MARNISEFNNDMKYVTEGDLAQQYVRKSSNDTLSGTFTIKGNLNVSGNVSAAQFSGLSDLKKKSNISPITNALAKVNQLDGYTYNLEGFETRKAGLIAQDVEEVFPECVVVDNEGNKFVDYNGIIAILVQAIKELSNK